MDVTSRIYRHSPRAPLNQAPRSPSKQPVFLKQLSVALRVGVPSAVKTAIQAEAGGYRREPMEAHIDDSGIFFRSRSGHQKKDDAGPGCVSSSPSMNWYGRLVHVAVSQCYFA